MPSAIAHLKEWREPFRIRVAIKKQNDYSKLNIFRQPERIVYFSQRHGEHGE